MKEFNFDFGKDSFNAEAILRKKTTADFSGEKIKSPETREATPVSTGDLLNLIDDLEANFEQITNSDDLKEKLALIEDKMETIDREQRNFLKEKSGADWLGHFYEGVAQARKKELGYYFLDENGVELFPGKYFEEVKDFANNMAEVKKDGVWYDLDKQGNLNEKIAA